MHWFASTFTWILGGLLGSVWAVRTVEAAVGMPSIADISESKWDLIPVAEPSVAIIVPAKNEEECIAQCLRSLLAQEYRNLKVIAVDDRSTDATGSIMDGIASEHPDRLQVLHVKELPNGWLGKTHAMWLAAQQSDSEWLLFTDGDVIFRSDSLRRAIAYAEGDSADHLVLYPTMIMKSPGERMMVGFLLVSVMLMNRAWKVADPKARDHIGVGAFNLIRREAYNAIGTYEVLRLEVIDDLKLGRAVKQHGFAQRNVLGYGLINLHWAKGAMGIANNLGKNFFAFVGYRWYLAIAACLVTLVINVGPFVGTIFVPGWARAGFVVALISIFVLYLGVGRKAKLSPVFFILYPVGCAFTVYAMLRSMYLTLTQGGVSWRGTKYSLEELRGASR